MIIRENSDLLKVENGVIAHGTNCLGVMGAGVAKSIRNKYYKCYSNYYTVCKSHHHPPSLLGTVDWYKENQDLFIANCFTQIGVGHIRQVNYGAVASCFSTLSNYCNVLDVNCNFPLIGGGLAGGDKEVLMEIFEFYFPEENGILHLI